MERETTMSTDRRKPHREAEMRSGAAARLKRRNEPSRGKADAPAEQSSIRIAKAMARAGLCSRREAERWIADGRVVVNGRRIETPAVDVGPNDKVVVDGKPLPAAEPVRLWRYHKPRGLVTTHADPEGRSTVFDNLPAELPRVISIGRLDLNTEGLLLLTNDGALARHLELPATGWLRRYRVRAHGRVTQEELDKLKDGVEIEGVCYGPVEATLDSLQGGNIWLTISLREGKNREVRRILESLGLAVNRLIRISYGPFQLLDLKPGEAEVVRRRVLADQLGPSLAEAFRLTGPDQDEVQRRRARRESNAQEPVPEATEPAVSEKRKGGGVDRPKDKALSLAKRRRRRLEAEASGQSQHPSPPRAVRSATARGVVSHPAEVLARIAPSMPSAMGQQGRAAPHRRESRAQAVRRARASPGCLRRRMRRTRAMRAAVAAGRTSRVASSRAHQERSRSSRGSGNASRRGKLERSHAGDTITRGLAADV